jgi:hypothetical protein
MAVKFFKTKRVTIPLQVFAMGQMYPRFECSWKGNNAIWTGLLKPSSLSDEYKVRIAYELGASPQVSVLSPSLKARSNGERIPHTYPGPRPCLYFPGSGEWRPDRMIADTIVPWTSLWLYYYEVWHATGEWLGGGEHPDVKTEKPEADNEG